MSDAFPIGPPPTPRTGSGRCSATCGRGRSSCRSGGCSSREGMHGGAAVLPVGQALGCSSRRTCGAGSERFVPEVDDPSTAAKLIVGQLLTGFVPPVFEPTGTWSPSAECAEPSSSPSSSRSLNRARRPGRRPRFYAVIPQERLHPVLGRPMIARPSRPAPDAAAAEVLGSVGHLVGASRRPSVDRAWRTARGGPGRWRDPRADRAASTISSRVDAAPGAAAFVHLPQVRGHADRTGSAAVRLWKITTSAMGCTVWATRRCPGTACLPRSWRDRHPTP